MYSIAQSSKVSILLLVACSMAFGLSLCSLQWLNVPTVTNSNSPKEKAVCFQVHIKSSRFLMSLSRHMKYSSVSFWGKSSLLWDPAVYQSAVKQFENLQDQFLKMQYPQKQAWDTTPNKHCSWFIWQKSSGFLPRD